MSRIEREDWLKMGENERVLWWDHPAFVMHLPPMILGACIALAAILVQFVPLPFDVPVTYRVAILAGGVVLGLFLVLYEFIRRKNIYYVVTTSKIWHTYGIISTNRNPIRYDRVSNVNVSQSYLERIISWFKRLSGRLFSTFSRNDHIGTVSIMTADDEGGDMLLENVPRIELVSQMIEDGMSGQADPGHARRGGAASRIEGFTSGPGTRQPQQAPQQAPPPQQQQQPQAQGQAPPRQGQGQYQGQGQPRPQGGQNRRQPQNQGQRQGQPRGGQGRGQGQGQGQGRGGGYPDQSGGGYPDQNKQNQQQPQGGQNQHQPRSGSAQQPPQDDRYPDSGGAGGNYPDEDAATGGGEQRRNDDDDRYPDSGGGGQ